jgi:hypothetical protein
MNYENPSIFLKNLRMLIFVHTNIEQGEQIFQKSLKFQNRHVDLDQIKNSKTFLQNTFFEMLSRFLRR